MDELFEKMQKLIVEKLDIDAAKVTLDASFRNDLGADSLDTYELVYAIEEELGVSIPDEKGGSREKPLSFSPRRPVPETDTGGRGENPKVLE